MMNKKILPILFCVVVLLFMFGCVEERTSKPEGTVKEEIKEKIPEAAAIPEELPPTEREASDHAEVPEQGVIVNPPVTSERRANPELPSERERDQLPDCTDKFFTFFPVDMSKIYEITPRGNLAPPGHTLPTDHAYFHISAAGMTTETIPLYVPGDATIINVEAREGITQDPLDYTIYFALCQDVIGYYNHVKALSDELTSAVRKVKCEDLGTADSCTKYIFYQVKAGTKLGEVGRLQGNFDFGLVDLRKPLPYANLERYPTRSRYIHCPFDYYISDMRDTFFNLIKRKDDQVCGVVAQDLPERLQGNWFHERAAAEYVVEWDTFLSFAHDTNTPEVQVVSIGGIFTQPSKYEFMPQISGTTNRDFSEVSADGKIYCYKDEQLSGDKKDEGRIIVQMTSSTELKIEHQPGTCPGTFISPEIYRK